jgi:hypothetical protein
MSTPAEQLARLRVRHGGLWRIDRQRPYQQAASGPGGSGPVLFVAVRRRNGLTLRDETAAGLEAKLNAADSGGSPAG